MLHLGVRHNLAGRILKAPPRDDTTQRRLSLNIGLSSTQNIVHRANGKEHGVTLKRPCHSKILPFRKDKPVLSFASVPLTTRTREETSRITRNTMSLHLIRVYDADRSRGSASKRQRSLQGRCAAEAKKMPLKVRAVNMTECSICGCARLLRPHAIGKRPGAIRSHHSPQTLSTPRRFNNQGDTADRGGGSASSVEVYTGWIQQRGPRTRQTASQGGQQNCRVPSKLLTALPTA